MSNANLLPSLLYKINQNQLALEAAIMGLTERTSSSASAFAVNPSTGGLSFLENYPVEEKQPRNIAFFTQRALVASDGLEKRKSRHLRGQQQQRFETCR